MQKKNNKIISHRRRLNTLNQFLKQLQYEMTKTVFIIYSHFETPLESHIFFQKKK